LLARAVPAEMLDPARDLLPPTLALGDMPRAVVEQSRLVDLRNGKLIDLPQPPDPRAAEIALLDADGNLLAIAQPRAGGWKAQPVKVFLGS